MLIASLSSAPNAPCSSSHPPKPAPAPRRSTRITPSWASTCLSSCDICISRCSARPSVTRHISRSPWILASCSPASRVCRCTSSCSLAAVASTGVAATHGGFTRCCERWCCTEASLLQSPASRACVKRLRNASRLAAVLTRPASHFSRAAEFTSGGWAWAERLRNAHNTRAVCAAFWSAKHAVLLAPLDKCACRAIPTNDCARAERHATCWKAWHLWRLRQDMFAIWRHSCKEERRILAVAAPSTCWSCVMASSAMRRHARTARVTSKCISRGMEPSSSSSPSARCPPGILLLLPLPLADGDDPLEELDVPGVDGPHGAGVTGTLPQHGVLLALSPGPYDAPPSIVFLSWIDCNLPHDHGDDKVPAPGRRVGVVKGDPFSCAEWLVIRLSRRSSEASPCDDGLLLPIPLSTSA
mmetsp:Transcript_15421/g.30458  ORF Transcript_15421/g.30458 Transcript_15421/m.30458 type:complete len:413 (+) Transcript_15421:381-1619(+)